MRLCAAREVDAGVRLRRCK